MRIGVLGSGIIGLWTAYELVQNGHEVTIYSNLPLTGTTSASAVAVVTPLFPWSLEQNPRLFNTSLRWFRETLEKFKEMNTHCDFMNVVPSYEFGYVDEHGVEVLEKGFPASRLTQLNFAPTKMISIETPITVTNEWEQLVDVSFAINFDADMVDTQIFLPYLKNELEQMGVEFKLRDFKSTLDISLLPHQVLFNCLGIQSHFLFSDVGPEMYPIRGQSHFIICDNEPPYYGVASLHHAVFRHKRGFYLGSYFLEETKRTWRDFMSENPKDLITQPTADEYLLTKKFATETYLKLARSVGLDPESVPFEKILRVNAGIRPFRVEGPVMERSQLGSKFLYHNFGHGAHGWTIGYGATREVVSLFMEDKDNGKIPKN